MNYYISYKKKDGNAIIIEIDQKTALEIRKLRIEHKCFGCTNGYPDKCLKIFDERKQTLSNYHFIEEGFEIIESETPITDESEIDVDNITKFIVHSCSNYKRAKKYLSDSDPDSLRIVDRSPRNREMNDFGDVTNCLKMNLKLK